MRHGSLFSGIGGFDLAAEWMGWENVLHCEINEFGRKVLQYYWPNAISYEDITKTDFTIHRGGIDIITGGFPCQPFSIAGKRKGTKDERHLWTQMLRAIREIQPRWVVGENVSGLVSWDGGVVFEQVHTDLEAQGYEVQAYILPACAVNAPHRRDRVWFVAQNSNTRIKGLQLRRKDGVYEHTPTPNTSSDRRERGWQGVEAKEGLQQGPESTGELERGFEGLCEKRDVAHADSIGFTGEKYWNGKSGFNSQFSIQPSWHNFPTFSPVCARNDGFPGKLADMSFSKWRNESIKSLGNAIVPSVVFQIFKAIDQYEKQRT